MDAEADMAWPKGQRRSEETRARIAASQRAYQARVREGEMVRCARCGRECKGRVGMLVHFKAAHGAEEAGVKA